MNDTNFGILNNMVLGYTNAFSGAYNNLHPTVTFIINFAIVVSVCLGGLNAALSDDGFPGVISFLTKKILLIGWVIFLVNNWQGITNIIAGGAVMLGFTASGTGGTESNFLNDPLTIFQDGLTLFTSMIGAALKMPNGLLSAIEAIPLLEGYTLAAFITLLAFAVIAIEILYTILEFKIICVAAVVFLGFLIWDKTAFLADRTYSFLGNSFLKLFTMALVIGIGMGFLNQFTVSPEPSFANEISIMVGSLTLAVLAYSIPKLATQLCSGGTSHSGGIGPMAAGAIGAAIVKAMQSPPPPPSGGGNGGSGGEAGTNSGVEQMRKAAVAGFGSGPAPYSQMAKAAATDSPSSTPPSTPGNYPGIGDV